MFTPLANELLRKSQNDSQSVPQFKNQFCSMLRQLYQTDVISRSHQLRICKILLKNTN